MILVVTRLIAADEGFTPLFNGKDLTGWKASEHPDTFTVQDGAIVAHGPRSHCFYTGSFHQHTFKDLELKLELKVDILTLPKANGSFSSYSQSGPWGSRSR
jgi:hypothetical protein